MISQRILTTALLAIVAAPVCCQDTDPAGNSMGSPKVSINGKTISDADLTSFSMMIEASEQRPMEDRKALINEYILTELYKEIPTTASADLEEKESPYKLSAMGQRQILKNALQRYLSNTVKVPRSDMEKWYESNSSKYVSPAKVKAYHLFMETSKDEPSSAPEKVRERLLKVKAEADKGTSFGLLASRNSEASSAKMGGEIGYVTPRMAIGPQSKPMNIALEETLFKLQPGKVSDVVQTSHGLHLLYISEKSTTITPTLDNLITSGILPGAVANEHVTSEIRNLVAQAVSKHSGKVAESTSGTQDQLTTQTPAFSFDGRKYTIADIENLYGARFTRFYQRARNNPDALKDLLKQALDDEAMVQAAVDLGLDKNGENADQILRIGKRAAAARRIQKIIAETFPVAADRAREIYEQQKEQMRRPEAEGEVLIAKAKESASPADSGRYRELAQKQAIAARELLESGKTFADAAKQIATKDVETSAGVVPRHIMGEANDPLGRAFDQATATSKDGELSQVVPFGNDYAIGKLTKRHAGEPVPFERVRSRLLQQAQSDNDRNAREELVARLKEKGLVKITDVQSTSTDKTQ